MLLRIGLLNLEVEGVMGLARYAAWTLRSSTFHCEYADAASIEQELFVMLAKAGIWLG